MKLKVLDLFSGIGGFSLGLERTGGFETVAFCEIDPFCRKVLAKHWPKVRQYTDVRELTADQLRADGIVPDVICGGFPCQDISFAGKGAGIEGERSGLWSEYARLIGELRPEYVIVENVAALLSRGLDRVLGDLASIGFDAEWHCIPASAVGAPHRRDRLWLIAYAASGRCDAPWEGFDQAVSGRSADWVERFGENVAHATGERRGETGEHSERRSEWSAGCGAVLADADDGHAQGVIDGSYDTFNWQKQVERQARLCSRAGDHHDWSIEPNVGRVAHGVPKRVDRLRALGNAVVPQIPELIGRAILEARAA